VAKHWVGRTILAVRAAVVAVVSVLGDLLGGRREAPHNDYQLRC
jgi:hypothetical protein